MKSFRPSLLFALSPLVFLLTSCGHVWSTSEDFVRSDTPLAQVNGAEIFPRLVPIGGDVGLSLNAMVYFAGSEHAAGPYEIFVVARGKTDVHETLTIRELRIHAPYGATEVIPYSMLGNPIEFRKTTDPAITQATYKADLAWDAGEFEGSGAVEFEIEASVAANGRTQTRTFRSKLHPQVRKDRKFGSITGELWRAARRQKELIPTR